MLNEKLLSAIWRFKIFSRYPLATISGKKVEIIHTGELNRNSGPDFLNAKIKIDDILWAGNIELHLKTSDFLKHKHQNDKNYQSLILHVVYDHDTDLQLPNTTEIIELKNFVSENTLRQYADLVNDQHTPACLNLWNTLDDFIIQNWLERIAIERLEKKFHQVLAYFEKTKDYQETFYRLFCRHLGFKVNNDAFEKLAERLPLKILLKHTDRLDILEALIYGTAGFLNRHYKDKYLSSLQNEFEFLKKKYGIESIEPHWWKFARMRPSNFPSLRLHQLALMLHHLPQMFHDPALFYSNWKNTEKLHLSPQGYFANHLTFEEDKFVNKSYTFGDTAVQHILINVAVPYLFFYGKMTGDERYSSMALNYLEQIPAENNSVLRKFDAHKKYIVSALQSQALLELYPAYCEQKRCDECNIGIKILTGRED